ncbi:MAG: hypothetical protein IPJ01_12675 [Micavibrio sp.]|nr:hypothetical protein [Micavibrio sp.]
MSHHDITSESYQPPPSRRYPPSMTADDLHESVVAKVQHWLADKNIAADSPWPDDDDSKPLEQVIVEIMDYITQWDWDGDRRL